MTPSAFRMAALTAAKIDSGAPGAVSSGDDGLELPVSRTTGTATAATTATATMSTSTGRRRSRRAGRTDRKRTGVMNGHAGRVPYTACGGAPYVGAPYVGAPYAGG